MNPDPNCAYCAEGAPLDAFGLKICELPAAKLYLFTEQSHRGRVIVASKFHVSEMVDLSDEDRRAVLDDVAHVARTLHKAFVPKYEGGFEYGGVFEMNPKRIFLQPAEYDALIAAIKAAL